MDAEEETVEKYRSRGVMKGQELLLRHGDAVRFIEDCQQSGLTILGMDFYREEGDDLIELPCSADFSSLGRKRDSVVQSVAAARRLIEDRLPEDAVWVSFVVEGTDR